MHSRVLSRASAVAVAAIVLSCASSFADTPVHTSVESSTTSASARPDIKVLKISKVYDAKDLLVSIVKKLNTRMGDDWLTGFRHAPELSAAQIDTFTKALENYLTPEERDFLALNLTGYRRAFDCPFVSQLEDRISCRENKDAREAILARYKGLGQEAKEKNRSLFDLILKEPRSAQLWHSQGKDVFARRLADAIRGMALTVETRRDRPGVTQRELGFERALAAYRHWTSNVETEGVSRGSEKAPVAKPVPVVVKKAEAKPAPAPKKTEAVHADTKPAPKAEDVRPDTPITKPAPVVEKKPEVRSDAPITKPSPVPVVEKKPAPKVEAKPAPAVEKKPAPKTEAKLATKVEAKPAAPHVVEVKAVTPAAKPAPVAAKPAPKATPAPVKAPVAKKLSAPAKKVVAKKIPAKKPASVKDPTDPANLKPIVIPHGEEIIAPVPLPVVDNDIEKTKESVHGDEVPAEKKPGFWKTVTKPVTNLVGGVKDTFAPSKPKDPTGVVSPDLHRTGEMTGIPIIHNLQEGKEYARYILAKLRQMAREDLARDKASYPERMKDYNARLKAYNATKHPKGSRPPRAPVKPTVSWYEGVRDGATKWEREAFIDGLDRLLPSEKAFLGPLMASIGEVGHITSGRCKGKDCVNDLNGISNGVSVLKTIYNSAKSTIYGGGSSFIDGEHHSKPLPDRMFWATVKFGRFSPWNYSGRFPSGVRTTGNIPGMLKSIEKALDMSDDQISKDLTAQKAERMINAYVNFSTENVNYEGFDHTAKGKLHPIVFFSAPGSRLYGTPVPSGPYVTYKNDPSRTKYYTSAHRFGYNKGTYMLEEEDEEGT